MSDIGRNGSAAVPPARRPARPADAAPTLSVAARLGEVGRWSTVLLLAMVATVAALLLWAALAEIDTVALAQGQLVPAGRVQSVQSLEGGTVSEVHVAPGQQVAPGDRLVTLSPTQADGDLDQRRRQALQLEARAARLQAESSTGPLRFSSALAQAAPDLVAAESAAFEARRAELAAQVAAMAAQLAQRQREQEETRITAAAAARALQAARQEHAMLEELVAKGLEPRIELVRIERVLAEAQGRQDGASVGVLRLDQAIVETRARLDALTLSFRAQAREDLGRTLGELRTLEPALPALRDRVDRTVLKAPTRGTVNRVLVNTTGGVVKPGETVVEIVPADEALVLETLVSPRDIGFVRQGQRARIRLSAYDAAIYGAIGGRVERVGADALTNDRGEAFYQVRVSIEGSPSDVSGRKLPLMAGMQAQVDILTGSQTVLRYLVKPLVSVRDSAFRER
ncbi:MAG: HlyD family type I secretion periplasmic adaptor subunit [Aquabacterium sp.]